MDRPCVTCLLRFFKKNIHPSFVSPSTSAKVIRIVLLFPPCATASNNVPLYLPYIQPRPADMDNWFTILLVQPTNPSTHCKLSPNKTTHLNGKIHKLIPQKVWQQGLMMMTSLIKSGSTQLHKCKMKSLWKLMMMLKFLMIMWNRKRKSKTDNLYEIKNINYVLQEVIVYIGINGCRGESSFCFYFL